MPTLEWPYKSAFFGEDVSTTIPRRKATACLHGESVSSVLFFFFFFEHREGPRRPRRLVITKADTYGGLGFSARASRQHGLCLVSLCLCGILSSKLDAQMDDRLVWRWDSNGGYSSRPACKSFFAGTTKAQGVEQNLEIKAPRGCRFIVWLAACHRCWIVDILHRRRRGLPRPAACPLCHQVLETLYVGLSSWGRLV
jgi:hypothetical protein